MTKEIRDIIKAYHEATAQGRQTALATVVHLEGSSYRRPGARMLIEDNGRMTGAISGGCLEGDVLKKALLAMSTGHNKIVTYNSSDEDDIQFGIQLGCNGIVHILFEPIDPAQFSNPVKLLEESLSGRRDAVIVTVFNLNTPQAKQEGTCLFYTYGKNLIKEGSQAIYEELLPEIEKVYSKRKSRFIAFEHQEAFIEFIEPIISLHIVGAGNDALPLIQIADVLGWQTTVIDGRPTHANKQRFPSAYKIIAAKPQDVVSELSTDERTVFVLMTHNYNYDLAILKFLLGKSYGYIGVLGPKKRLQRMLNDLEKDGNLIDQKDLSDVYGPTGLDIGAETSEEIALSIIAEIKASLENREGFSLRLRADSIHSRLDIADKAPRE